jgi:uncharacterized membrane protein
MTIQRFLEWLAASPVANAMNGPEWAFPVVESLHFIGFAFLIGTIAIVDLRLLGLTLRRQPSRQLQADLAPWTLAGVAIMLTTGPMMFSADAVRYYVNPSVRIKMMCLATALVYNFTLHRMAARSEKPGVAGIIAACVSLLLWTSVLGAGRMIAFV